MSALAPRPKHPAFKFETVGTEITGTIAYPPADSQVTDFVTKELKFWPDGNPIMQTKIVLKTGDGSHWAIYARGRMATAITKALIDAQAPDLEVGGQLVIRRTADQQSKQGGQPAKDFVASYTKPAAPAAAEDDGWDSEEPPF